MAMDSIVFLILSSCLAVKSVVWAAPVDGSACQTMSCGILLDVGSSSTKLKIYAWDHPDNNAGIPQILPVEFEGKAKFKPGLATFKDDRDSMRTNVIAIIEVAKKVIPHTAYETTPIFAMATAGFRLLGIADAEKGMIELNLALLNKTINPFLFEKGHASVISGEEEGVYSWLAANFLGGFFNTSKPDPLNAVGVLEMGGGSTQIAFIPRDPLMAEEYQVMMGGRQYSLYVQSYLKFGSSSIKEKLAAHLYKNSCFVGILNYCNLKGDVQNITLNNGKEVEMFGAGNAERCQEAFSKIVAPAPPEQCNMPPCAIGSVFQPPVDGIDFYATSAYKYPIRGVGFKDDVLDIPAFWEKAKTHCQKMLINVPEGDRKHANADCSDAVYIYSLLTGPYGFPVDTKHIKVNSERNGGKIDWALGAMLEHLSMSFTGNRTLCSTTARRRK